MVGDVTKNLQKEIAQVDSSDGLKDLWQKYLGKSGVIKLALKELGQLSDSEKKTKGPKLQKALVEAKSIFEIKEKELAGGQSEAELKKQAEHIGFSLPKVGHLHPITQTIREMNKMFLSMGYSIVNGPEIETDEYCFQRLNVPADHPARDMQDTIYVDQPNILLRTQTSSIEAHVLEDNKPPFKVVCPGRVYRNEKTNKSNHFIFHHYQGVVVGEDISLKDLFGTFTALFEKMYGDDVVIRYRNKYYPEVEPGVGPDMQCFSCHGKGCPICKGAGWIEMGGAGIIHPKVLKMAGIDPKKYRGFAFGLGLDRWTMAKYKIEDIRTLLGGNLGYKYFEGESDKL